VKTTHSKIAFLAAFVLVLAIVPVALAGKGAGGGGGGKPGGGTGGAGTLTLRMVTDRNSDGLPNFADAVTFDVSTTATNPWVHLQCRQNRALVGEARYGAYPSYQYAQYVNLGPTNYWQSGAADCTAYLELYSGGKWQQIGSTSFHVNA